MDEETKKEIEELLKLAAETFEEISKSAGKTPVEVLELNRPEDWVDRLMDEAQEFLTNKSPALTLITDNYLQKMHPESQPFIMASTLTPAIAELCNFMMKIAYLKATQVTEDKYQLEKMWES